MTASMDFNLNRPATTTAATDEDDDDECEEAEVIQALAKPLGRLLPRIFLPLPDDAPEITISHLKIYSWTSLDD